MGEFDSSRTRVVKVFDKLLKRDPSGESWIAPLIGLASRADSVAQPRGPLRLLVPNQTTWGNKELSLTAPKALLRHLVRHIAIRENPSEDSTREVVRKRRALSRRDPATLAEALARIETGPWVRKWYILEGPSRPDATLEMPNAVIVIEGKRTESATTAKTTFMPKRSQLIRHMDAAMEKWPGKEVFGLLIVEGQGGADAVEPSRKWRELSAAQTAPDLLAASLPHRGPDERTIFASRDLGVTTWQAVCREFNIPWPPG